MKVTVILGVIGALGKVTKGLLQGLGRLRNNGTIGEHTNYNIDEIGQNTEKCPGDVKRLATTQTPVKDYQLTLI